MKNDAKIYIDTNGPVYENLSDAIKACDGTGKTIFVIPPPNHITSRSTLTTKIMAFFRKFIEGK